MKLTSLEWDIYFDLLDMSSLILYFFLCHTYNYSIWLLQYNNRLLWLIYENNDRFLRGCHFRFDEDLKFEDRITDQKVAKDTRNRSLFRRVVVGNNRHVINAGDVVILSPEEKQSKKVRVYVRIIHFEVRQVLASTQVHLYRFLICMICIYI